MLGREIKRERIERGLTQRELAKAIGVKVREVINWEDGVRPVNRNIEKLERFFDFVPGHLKYLPTTPQMPYEFVTYHNGLPTDYFFAETKKDARKIFNEKITNGDMALRTWEHGVKLTLHEAEEMLSAWHKECHLPTIERGAAPNATHGQYKNGTAITTWRKN